MIGAGAQNVPATGKRSGVRGLCSKVNATARINQPDAISSSNAQQESDVNNVLSEGNTSLNTREHAMTRREG